MEERVMVITGTRKGIGNYLALYYLERGFYVVGCSRGESSIEHERYRHYRLDVADEKSVVEMVRGVRNEFGGIDILLNNAGAASMNHFVITPYKTVKEMMEVNYYGTFIFSREVSKVMLKKRFGRIVNFVSVAAPLRVEGEAAYAVSKAAVENLTRVSAREVAEYGITVNAIGATPIWTDMIRNVLIDKKSDFITGQVIYLGGVS